MKNSKNIILPAIAALVVVAVILSITVPKFTKDSSENNLSIQNKEIFASNFTDDIVIDESSVTETASFYTYDADGTDVEIFAVKASDGTVRIAFNTCQICNGSPYAYFVQQGDRFVCQNCNNSFSRDDIGIVQGGCNPIPVTESDYRLDDGNIIIPKQFLEQYKDNFSNRKSF